MGAKKPQLKDKQIKEKILEHYGNLSQVAKECGVSRQTIYKRVQANEELQMARLEADAILVDLGESALVRAINDTQPWAVGLVLKTKGKGRGYVERQEVDVEGEITFRWLNENDPDPV